MRAGLLVPTLNAGARWADWLTALASQSRQPDAVIVIDSGSSDGTATQARAAGLPVVSIPPEQFDHGGTRNLGVASLTGCDIIVCLTQDAILADPHALAHLLSAFDDAKVAMAYGRQLPHADATPIAAHARHFNYPPQSRRVCFEDRATLGLKAAFASNSFAAWRGTALQAVGGFPANTLFGEDTQCAARLLMAGGQIAYVAEATVFHSHNYGWREEFRRYADIGALHALQPWLLAEFGRPEGEGLRFVRSEFRFLRDAGWRWRMAGMRQSAAKLLGYRIGKWLPRLPASLAARCSTQPRWWLRRERRT